MTFARSVIVLACALSCAAPAVLACNPAPPRLPILQGYSYDATAAEYILAEATSVVAARLTLVLDLELGDAGAAPARKDYVFEVIEGWRLETSRRLTIGGHWVDCGLQPRAGRAFLLYLDGERLLHAVPVEQIDFELGQLGEPDWFYDARGRLVRGAED
jgi:hypothetical protein